MIRATIRNGKVQPLEDLPEHWRDGQEVVIEAADPSGDPEEIRKWYQELRKLSAQIPPEDHERMALAIARQDREAKERMRGEMELN